MPDLSNYFFAGRGSIPADLARTLEVNGPGASTQAVIAATGWDGHLVAGVNLFLSPDNDRVINGSFFLLGHLSEDLVAFQAAKVWAGAAENITMHLQPPPAAAIRFPQGRLHSEILASRDTKFAFFKAGALGAAPTSVPEAEWEENGLGDFSVRLVCHISKSTKNATGVLIRITLLLFPVGAETLVAMTDLTAEAYWPGSKILECECPLYPPPGQVAWGCPFLPVLWSGTPFADLPTLPPAEEMRRAIAAIMRTATCPECHISATRLQARWDRIQRDPTFLQARTPILTWPDAARPATPQGKHIFSFILVQLCERHKTRVGERAAT